LKTEYRGYGHHYRDYYDGSTDVKRVSNDFFRDFFGANNSADLNV